MIRDFILAIRLGQLHLDHFVRVGRDGLADHVGMDGKLAMAAVDEDGEHALCAAGRSR